MLKIGTYKYRFYQTLRPFIDLLENQRENVDFQEWLSLVNRTQSRVIKEPEQYLGVDLPPAAVIKNAIAEIFEELIAQNAITPDQVLNPAD